MNVTHFAGSICRFARAASARTTTDARRVTCKTCRRSTMVLAAAVEQKREREAAIEASPALPVTNPWNGAGVSCSSCGGLLFKDAGRSLDHFNHLCADPECGKMMHTMTETGMSA